MGEKSTKAAKKLPIDGIDRSLGKEEGLPKCSELFSLLLLVPEWMFAASQPLTLIFFDNQLHFSLSWSTYLYPHHDCIKFSSPFPDCLILICIMVGLILLVVIVLSLSCLLVVAFLFNIIVRLLVIIFVSFFS